MKKAYLGIMIITGLLFLLTGCGSTGHHHQTQQNNSSSSAQQNKSNSSSSLRKDSSSTIQIKMSPFVKGLVQNVNPKFGLVSLSKPNGWQIWTMYETYRLLNKKPLIEIPVSKRRFSKVPREVGIGFAKGLNRNDVKNVTKETQKKEKKRGVPDHTIYKAKVDRDQKVAGLSICTKCFGGKYAPKTALKKHIKVDREARKRWKKDQSKQKTKYQAVTTLNVGGKKIVAISSPPYNVYDQYYWLSDNKQYLFNLSLYLDTSSVKKGYFSFSNIKPKIKILIHTKMNYQSTVEKKTASKHN